MSDVLPELDSHHLAKAVAVARMVAARPGLAALIVAEPGSPSEEVARLIHDHAGVAGNERPFATVRCRGVPERVTEAELFGNCAGAPGIVPHSAVSRARTGTLFIEDIAHLGLGAQARLSSMLADRHKRGLRDCRVIASAATDLRGAVRAGAFLPDLRALLSVVTIELPPLRTRPDDVERLASNYLRDHVEARATRIETISAEALSKLRAHDFVENERELREVVARAVALETTRTLRAESIEGAPVTDPGDDALSRLSAAVADRVGRPATLAEIERAYISWMLRHTRWNRTAAARMLGISYPTIAKKIADFRIEIPQASSKLRSASSTGSDQG